MSFLIWSRSGWIANMLYDLLKKQGEEVHWATSRLENRESVAKELDTIRPKYVLNAAGVTGRPNVDWCEDHKPETIRSNVIGALNLADLCAERKIHLTVFATGCIYEYDDAHPIGSGRGYTEDDPPNFTGSFYSLSKGMVEKLMRLAYPDTLILRLRMPISDDLHPRSFVTKITRYAKVVNIPNSMTVLTEMLPIAIDLTKRGRTGVYNFTNPGTISHNEVLALYKKYIDPNFTWNNFTIEEQARILKAGRSNNELDVSKLLAEYPNLTPIKQAMEGVFQRMKANMEKDPPKTA